MNQYALKLANNILDSATIVVGDTFQEDRQLCVPIIINGESVDLMWLGDNGYAALKYMHVSQTAKEDFIPFFVSYVSRAAEYILDCMATGDIENPETIRFMKVYELEGMTKVELEILAEE